MIKLYSDLENLVEIKESIDLGEAYVGETRKQKFWIEVKDVTEIRDLSIEVIDETKQIFVKQPPETMKNGEIFEGYFLWKSGLFPPKTPPKIIVRGTEVIEHGVKIGD